MADIFEELDKPEEDDYYSYEKRTFETFAVLFAAFLIFLTFGGWLYYYW